MPSVSTVYQALQVHTLLVTVSRHLCWLRLLQASSTHVVLQYTLTIPVHLLEDGEGASNNGPEDPEQS